MVIALPIKAQWYFGGGYSHNDSKQKRPLIDALENGIVSIEVDVFLHNGEILVGNEENELETEKTLKGLYLEPLLQMAHASDKRLTQIILFVDIKDRGEETYAALKKLLPRYQSMLSYCLDKTLYLRQVTVIVSGNLPIDLIRKEKQRFVFIDGRVDDLKKKESSKLFPVISEDWNNFFAGDLKNMKEKELNKLRKIILECHSQGKLFRFWGLSTNPSEQKKLQSLFRTVGVDLWEIAIPDPEM